MSAHDASFDLPVSGCDDDKVAFAPAAYLEHKNSDPALLLEASDWQDHHQTKMRDALLQLDPRSQDILEQRWLADEKLTLHDLASQYGVSAERIRQLEAKAIADLKQVIVTG